MAITAGEILVRPNNVTYMERAYAEQILVVHARACLTYLGQHEEAEGSGCPGHSNDKQGNPRHPLLVARRESHGKPHHQPEPDQDRGLLGARPSRQVAPQEDRGSDQHGPEQVAHIHQIGQQIERLAQRQDRCTNIYNPFTTQAMSKKNATGN